MKILLIFSMIILTSIASANTYYVATTPNRYITITEINSDKLDVQKVRKWGIGFQVGYGTSITAPKLSPFIGIGLSRNIIRF